MKFISLFRPRKETGHLIISGTGRSGTTFLVQYLTAIGLDTGFTLDEALQGPDDISRGGLEHSLGGSEPLPDVVKSPWLVDELPAALQERRISVRRALIPVRDLHDAAESRRRVFSAAQAQGRDPLNHPGTIWRTTEPDEQEAALAVAMYHLLETLARHRIPVTLLPFPEIVHDHEALFVALSPELQAHGISRSRSLEAFDKVVNPAFVHSFGKG